jgi:hypothetical protein
MTLLRVDTGIDTGPVYLHGTCEYDEDRDSHIVIQQRAVVENLDAVGETLIAVARGEQPPRVDTAGRQSAVWGQPRLTSYLRWKLAARRAANAAPLKGRPAVAADVGSSFAKVTRVGRPFMGRHEEARH